LMIWLARRAALMMMLRAGCMVSEEPDGRREPPDWC